jgi:small subunit ribosomal protein S16
MVVIRLARTGMKNSPRYRIMVADQKYSVTKRFLEIVGSFNPKAQGQDKELVIDMERVNSWIAKGAQPSERVRSLIRKAQGASAKA